MEEILKPQDIIKILEFPTKEQECFLVVLLNGRLQIIEQKLVFLGSLNECSVHVREIFRDAIKKNSAGKIIGIDVLDHIIIGEKFYYSFFEESEKHKKKNLSNQF
jgi:DNA repair protein RadC